MAPDTPVGPTSATPSGPATEAAGDHGRFGYPGHCDSTTDDPITGWVALQARPLVPAHNPPPVLVVIDSATYKESAPPSSDENQQLRWKLRKVVSVGTQYYAIGTVRVAGETHSVTYFCDACGRVTDWIELLSQTGSNTDAMCSTLSSLLGVY